MTRGSFRDRPLFAFAGRDTRLSALMDAFELRDARGEPLFPALVLCARRGLPGQSRGRARGAESGGEGSPRALGAIYGAASGRQRHGFETPARGKTGRAPAGFSCMAPESDRNMRAPGRGLAPVPGLARARIVRYDGRSSLAGEGLTLTGLRAWIARGALCPIAFELPPGAWTALAAAVPLRAQTSRQRAGFGRQVRYGQAGAYLLTHIRPEKEGSP